LEDLDFFVGSVIVDFEDCVDECLTKVALLILLEELLLNLIL
jgi:hypothetical protein